MTWGFWLGAVGGCLSVLSLRAVYRSQWFARWRRDVNARKVANASEQLNAAIASWSANLEYEAQREWARATLRYNRWARRVNR